MEYSLSEMSGSDIYRLLTTVIVPRPIAWVTSIGRDGVVNAAPFSFFNILGSDPPIVAMGVSNRKSGDPKDTAANILHSGECVVHLVDETLADAMNITAIEFEAGISELAEAGLTTAPSVVVSTPRIAEAKVHLECRLNQIVEIGNNRIILAQVVHVHLRDGETPETLNFIARMHGGGWYSRTRDRFDLPRITPAQWKEKVGRRS